MPGWAGLLAVSRFVNKQIGGLGKQNVLLRNYLCWHDSRRKIQAHFEGFNYGSNFVVQNRRPVCLRKALGSFVYSPLRVERQHGSLLNQNNKFQGEIWKRSSFVLQNRSMCPRIKLSIDTNSAFRPPQTQYTHIWGTQKINVR